MRLRTRHTSTHIPWPLLLVAAPLWAGAGMIYLTVWSMAAMIRLAVWAVAASTATHRGVARPPMPAMRLPARGQSAYAAGHAAITAEALASLTWRDAAWWRTPVRDLINRPTPKDPR